MLKSGVTGREKNIYLLRMPSHNGNVLSLRTIKAGISCPQMAEAPGIVCPKVAFLPKHRRCQELS